MMDKQKVDFLDLADQPTRAMCCLRDDYHTSPMGHHAEKPTVKQVAPERVVAGNSIG
jgi:hypothetical protein